MRGFAKPSLDKAVSKDTFDDIFAFTKENGLIHATEIISERFSEGAEHLDFTYPQFIAAFENNNDKYWNTLSSANSAVLSTLKKWAINDCVEISLLTNNDLHPTFLLLRYLRYNQFNIPKAKAHILKSIEWRKANNVPALIKQSPEEILGCRMEDLMNVFPHWHSGYDKTSRPVVFKQYGKFDAGLIKKLLGGSFDNIVRYHIWEQEACGRLCHAQSLKTRSIIETVTYVLDIKDMKLKQVNSDFLNLIKLLSDIDGKQYPETIGRIFVINAFTSFALAWRMVKPWIVPTTAAKMKILGGPKEFIPVLQDFIGEENLPSNYGGTLPPLSPQVHPYAESVALHAAKVRAAPAAHAEPGPKGGMPPVSGTMFGIGAAEASLDVRKEGGR